MRPPPLKSRVRSQSWRRKTVFAAVAVLLFFVGLEVGLMLLGLAPVVSRDPFVGFASEIPLFDERVSTDGRAMLVTAENKRAFFNAQRFPRKKPPNTRRVFCVGGSTTYGRPYDDATSFAGWLRELLPVADPSRNWEVINAGGISYASYRVARVMERLARYEPDLFVVYCGHNEFLEERTYREIKQLSPALRGLLAQLSRTRTYAAFDRALDPLLRHDGGRQQLPGEVEAILDRTAGPELYQRDDRLRDQVLEHFRLNLARMVQIARSAGAEILFVVPASNLKDASPFKSQYGGGLSRAQWRRVQRLDERSDALHRSGDFDGALAACQAAVAIDQRSAALQYRLGRILFALGRHEAARAAFRRARDEDICPLRAPSEFVQSVRRMREHAGVSVVDFAALVESACVRRHEHGIPGREFFLDHVHPTIAGHRMLAVAIVDEWIRREALRPGSGWGDAAIDAVSRRIEERIDRRQHALALRNLAKVLTWAGKRREAGRLALEALETLPDDEECLIMAGTALRLDGQARESFDHFCRALRDVADPHAAHLRLARLAAAEGRTEQARLHRSEALRLDPELRGWNAGAEVRRDQTGAE